MTDFTNFSRPIFSLKVFWSVIFALFVSHFGSTVSHFGSIVWAAEEKPIGTIIGIIGTVEMKAGGGSEPVAKAAPGKLSIKPVSFDPDAVWQKAKFKQEVYASDNFRTKRGSRLKIKFNDNSLLALGPNSRMSIGSYQLDKSQKFRKGVINVAKGLSMYIINKSQKNKDSSFKVITPTANLSSRGTFGFISSSATKTIVANKTGAMSASNVDPNIAGNQLVGANSVSTIPQGQAPTVPQTMSNNNFNSISTVVLGRIGTSLPSSMFNQGSGGTGQQSTSQSSGSSSSDSSSSSPSGGDSSSSQDSNAGGGDSVVADFVSVAGPDIGAAFAKPVNVPFAAVAATCAP